MTRQLRMSPLSVRAYFRAKVLTGYAMALSSLLVLYISASLLGVSLHAGQWLARTGTAKTPTGLGHGRPIRERQRVAAEVPLGSEPDVLLTAG